MVESLDSNNLELEKGRLEVVQPVNCSKSILQAAISRKHENHIYQCKLTILVQLLNFLSHLFYFGKKVNLVPSTDIGTLKNVNNTLFYLFVYCQKLELGNKTLAA